MPFYLSKKFLRHRLGYFNFYIYNYVISYINDYINTFTSNRRERKYIQRHPRIVIRQ